MKQRLILAILLGTLLGTLLAYTIVTKAQYMQKLYDCDSTDDWGINLFLNNDGTYFTVNQSFKISIYQWELVNLIISSDGNTLLNKKLIRNNNSSIFVGNPGEIKKLYNGNYIAPYTVQTPNITYGNSTTGFMKLNPISDTLFIKTYFDTSVNF